MIKTRGNIVKWTLHCRFNTNTPYRGTFLFECRIIGLYGRKKSRLQNKYYGRTN